MPSESFAATAPALEVAEFDTVFDDPEQLADHGNAARFLNAYRETTRYSYARKKFYCFDRGRWSDDQAIVEGRANRIVQAIRYEKRDTLDEQKDLFKHYIKSQSPERRSAMLALARAEIAIDPALFDFDPDLFNIVNGTVNLLTGEFRPHEPKDLCSKISRVNFQKDVDCPRWKKFLEEIFDGDRDLVAFIKRAVGYTLSGHTIEQKLFLLYGVGKNGKSTFLAIVRRLLGEYATHAQMETFTARNRGANGHTEDLANLCGARLVTAVETEESKRLSEGLIKQITGGDPVTASKKNEHSFTFTPQFKLWLAANHKPVIRGTDEGIWRRPMLIPFNVKFEIDPEKRTTNEREGDPRIESKLLAEISGILNWALEGYREWLDQGLRPPQAVRVATESYRQESDMLAHFIEEELVPLPRADQPGNTGGEIFKAYQLWCDNNGEKALNNRQFGDALAERGFAKKKVGGMVRYFGIGLSVRTVQDILDSSSGRNAHVNQGKKSTQTTVQTVPNCPAISNLNDLAAQENPPEDPNFTPPGWQPPF